MKRTALLLLFGLLFGSVPPQTAVAGAWAREKGGYYTKLTLIYSDADGIFGNASPATFTDYSLYFYGEYGLLPRMTLQLSTPFFKDSENEANFLRGNTRGYFAGDLELQAKYQILDAPVVASLLGGVKLPVGYDVVEMPPLGNGETDFDAKLLLGTSFYPVPVYVTGDIGYRVRGGDFVNEIHYTLEAGYTLLDRFLLRFLTTGVRSSGGDEGESNLFGFPLAQDRTRYGGGIIFLLTDRVELDVSFLETTSGRNIPMAGEFFVGVAFKR